MVDTLDRLRGVQSSLAVKAPVNAKSTGNLTLSGFQTVDGITFSEGEALNKRVLANDQTDPVENGIYDMGEGAWSRSADFDGANDAAAGTLVFVRNGTVAANSLWRCATANPIEFDADEISFTEVGATGTNGSSGVNGLFAGTETQVTARPGDLLPMQDISNASTAARAESQSVAETGRHALVLQPFRITEEVSSGQQAAGMLFTVPAFMTGFQLVAAQASHYVQGSGGSATSIQIQKNLSNMFTTPLTIDSGEANSGTAASAVAISTSVGVVATFDNLTVDVNAVPSTTAPLGLTIALTFQRPATT